MNENTYSQLTNSLQQNILDFLGTKEMARTINPASKDNMRNGYQSIIQKFLDKEADEDVIRFLENYCVTRLLIGGFPKLVNDLGALPLKDIAGWLFRASLTQKNSKPTPILLAMIIVLQMQEATDQEEKHRLLSLLQFMALNCQGAPAVALCLDVINPLPGKRSAMQELFESKYDEVKANAIELSGLWGQAIIDDSKKLEIIKKLMAKLGGCEWYSYVREAFTQALGSIVFSLSRDEDKQEIIKELIAKFGDDVWVPQNVARALGSTVSTLSCDEDKQEIIKELIPKLGDDFWCVRETTAQALGRIVPTLSCDKDKQKSIDGLIAKLDDDAWWVRKAAAQALGRIVPTLSCDKDKQKSIDGLIAKLDDTDRYEARYVRETAAQALGSIVSILSCDEGKRESIKGLMANLDNNFRAVPQAAAQALGSIVSSLSRDEDKQEIIKELIAILGNTLRCWDIRKAAAQALGSIVPTLHDEQAKKILLLESLENQSFSFFKVDTLVEVVAMVSQIKDEDFHKELLSKQTHAGNGTFLSENLFKKIKSNPMEYHQSELQAIKPYLSSLFFQPNNELKNADLDQDEANTHSHTSSRCVIS